MCQNASSEIELGMETMCSIVQGIVTDILVVLVKVMYSVDFGQVFNINLCLRTLWQSKSCDVCK